MQSICNVPCGNTYCIHETKKNALECSWIFFGINWLAQCRVFFFLSIFHYILCVKVVLLYRFHFPMCISFLLHFQWKNHSVFRMFFFSFILKFIFETNFFLYLHFRAVSIPRAPFQINHSKHAFNFFFSRVSTLVMIKFTSYADTTEWNVQYIKIKTRLTFHL